MGSLGSGNFGPNMFPGGDGGIGPMMGGRSSSDGDYAGGAASHVHQAMMQVKRGALRVHKRSIARDEHRLLVLLPHAPNCPPDPCILQHMHQDAFNRRADPKKK
jgi:hypothetical protein